MVVADAIRSKPRDLHGPLGDDTLGIGISRLEGILCSVIATLGRSNSRCFHWRSVAKAGDVKCPKYPRNKCGIDIQKRVS
jgi:hypothetical protein